MSYAYVFHEVAQREYEAAVVWYAERSIKAAENFIAAVDHALELICAHPDRWRNEYGHYRELGLKKYPFVVVYSFDPQRKEVLVTAVFHTSRSVRKKYRKK